MEDQNSSVKESVTEDITAQESTEEEVENTLSSEIIEVEWEEVSNIFHGKALVNQMQDRLGAMCVQFERAKQKMVKEMSDIEAILYQEGSTLKESMNIDPELTYELKLPASEGEKAFFIRKDQ